MKDITALNLFIGVKAFRFINGVYHIFDGIGAVVRRGGEIVQVWRKRMKSRRELFALLDYSDWELSDIGVTRTDIQCEASKFFWTA